MALSATVRRFLVEVSDTDRGIFESLDLRVAQHPSEAPRYLVARVLARCLEHAEGVDFTRGLAADEEPALWQRDLQGQLRAWIEVGSPSPERLHRASKTGARVVVYGWKNVAALAQSLAEQKVHRRQELQLYELEQPFLDAVGATLERHNEWSLTASGALYLTAGGKLFEGTCERVPVPG